MHLDLSAHEADDPSFWASLPLDIRVKQGMALCDERFGPEWVNYIDLASLDLTDGCRCILGQLAEEYAAIIPTRWEDDGYSLMARQLSLGDNDATSHGFLALDESGCEDLPTYEALEVEWTLQIANRRLEIATHG